MKPRQAFIPFLRLLLVAPRGVMKALLKHTKEAHQKHRFGRKRIKYVDIREVVGVLNEQVKSYTYMDGTSRTSDIAFIKAVCRKYDSCNYLEIGSWRGESISNIASVSKSCTSISLSKQKMIHMGLSPEVADVQSLLSKNLSNINHVEANSQSFDFNKLKKSFDVIFIDGDHTYDGVKSDTINAFKMLKNEKSVITWHDCGFGMEDLRYESIMAIHDGCPTGAFEKVYRVSNTMCCIYSQETLQADEILKPAIPTKLFDIAITAVQMNE
jgi:hypothetical protein